MGGTHIPGPLKGLPPAGQSHHNYYDPDKRCSHPGVTGRAGSVAELPLDERFKIVMHKTAPLLPGEVGEEFTQLLDPYVLGAIVVTLVAWAGSHYFGVGFIMDGLLVGVGFFFLGLQVLSVISDLVNAVKLTTEARTSHDLDMAAAHFANFIAVVGVAAFLALLTKKGVSKGSPKLKYMAKARRWAATAADAGMPVNHFNAFKRVASESQLIILVRQTNPKSIQWIQRGFPGKPKALEFAKTSQTTGLTTCKADQIAKARNTQKLKPGEATGPQYYVVDRNRRTATNGNGEAIDLSKADWPVEHGQIIDPVVKKPIPGDYDLMGVIDPNHTSANLALVSSEGQTVSNFTNHLVKQVGGRVNDLLDQPRVLHGAEEAYGNWGRIKADEVVVGFFPDGTTTAVNRNGLIQMYQSWGRKLIDMKSALNID